MASQVEVKVPDIGDFKEVAVIEVMVKPGETIAVDTGLIMVESDKASMEIPSSAAGVVKEIKVKVDDKVSEGSVILVIEATGAAASAPAPVAAPAAAPTAPAAPASHPGAVKSPMVGTAYRRPNPDSAPFVDVGSVVKAGDKIVLVEAMKTFNEIVAPKGGTVTAIFVEDGQPVEYDQTLVIIE